MTGMSGGSGSHDNTAATNSHARRIARRREERRDGLSVRQFVRERMQGRTSEVFNKRSLAAKGLSKGWSW